ncbi:lipid IV(A) 3-deoxy-D-manno-octulosonic acid transferase [Acidiferrobacter sp.]|uniref:lipid IV(A) 3-deoxy-D-manno-octulosonic acid transferase n=1 Tax=Acidiferrobacter sp. TaxID=1872107 RepID=UPI002624A703|nr:lipid IV(A) 3-deoxy-D-manno-octulosonic acid transferase [Acidiferrobacter sp.]
MRLYRFTARLVLPFALVRLWWRSRNDAEYAPRWTERLGYGGPIAGAPIWVHAVSVGETRAAAPLIRALLDDCPQTPVLVTTTTLTGAAQVAMLFGEGVIHRFAPFDLPGAVARFLDRTRPRVAIILETEIWPQLFATLARRRVPVFLANVRLSERSFRRYQRIPRLIAAALGVPAVIAAQSQADAMRLRALGAPAARVHVTGNMKFELSPTAGLREAAQALRLAWGERPVWVAASTHQGEEEVVLTAHRVLQETFPRLLLVLVPRHPERFEAVGKMVRSGGMVVVARSAGGPVTDDTEVLLGDTMGELMLFFAAADCAFIGGSLVATGGHNPLEALALGVPVVFGPHMFNFDEVARLTRSAGAGVQVADEDGLIAALRTYLGDPEARRAASESGEALVRTHQGALGRTRALLAPFLTSPAPSSEGP